MDGYVTLKTKLDNKEIDKDIAQLESKIQKLQEENIISQNEQSSFQAEIDSYEELTRQADEYKQKIKELKAQRDLMVKENPLMSVQIDTPELANVKSQITEVQNKYANATKEIDKQSPKIDKLYSKLDKVKSKQSENNSKITEYKQKIEQINTNKIQSDLNNVGKNLQKQIKSVGKMAMAVIGIRTAWYAVRGAINAVTQYNEQVATDFEYMRFCIANMLVPAVQWLIQLLYTVLSYVNAIMSGWFGINLFSNSSVKAFEKMKKNASGTAKAVKEIQKSLQGFDEMNVLQDNSGSQTGSSGAGGVTPSIDLSGLQAEIPSWIQWIINNKNLIISTLMGIAGAILAIKLGLSFVKGLGIGVMLAGIVFSIQALVSYLKDPSWTNFGKIIQGIGVAIIGLAITIASVPVAVAGAIILIIGTIVKYWEEIKAFLQGGIDWLTNKIDWVRENFGIAGELIYTQFITIAQFLLNTWDNIFTTWKDVLDGVIEFITGVFTGDWQQAWEGLRRIGATIINALMTHFQNLWNLVSRIFGNIKNAGETAFWGIVDGVKGAINAIISAVNKLILGLNKIQIKVPDWSPVNPGATFGVNIPTIPKLAKGGIIAQPTQAIIGEAGTEAIMPLENNLEWLDILADKLASKIGSGNGAVNVYLDGRLIQRQLDRRKQQLAFATNGR